MCPIYVFSRWCSQELRAVIAAAEDDRPQCVDQQVKAR